jgi:hypothetical protein
MREPAEPYDGLDRTDQACTIVQKNKLAALGLRYAYRRIHVVGWLGYRATIRVTALITAHNAQATDSCTSGGRQENNRE